MMRCCDAVVAVNAVPPLNASSTAPLSASSSSSSSNLNGSTQMLAPYAAAAAAAAATGFPNDVLGMMPYFYPGLGYYPGAAAAGIPFMQPPAILPGTHRRRPSVRPSA